MGITTRMRCCRVVSTIIISTCSQALFAGYPVAGVTPYERPQGAPSITAVVHDADWYQRALTGISRPYPSSLRFLENQGNWYTPFIHPGMGHPYDIRGWHR